MLESEKKKGYTYSKEFDNRRYVLYSCLKQTLCGCKAFIKVDIKLGKVVQKELSHSHREEPEPSIELTV